MSEPLIVTRRRLLAAAAAAGVTGLLPRTGSRAAAGVRLAEVPLGGPGLAPSAGRRLATSLPYRASHLGVRWAGDDTARVVLAWRTLAGEWSGWRPLELAHDLGDEERGVRFSGLVRAEEAREVAVAVTGGRPAALTLIAIDATDGPRPPSTTRAKTSSGEGHSEPRVAQPEMVTRAGWGADESRRKGQPSFAKTIRMAVHHTTTDNHDPDPASTVRAIYAYHTAGNGWDDIGYNFLIDAEGRIYEGRWARAYEPGELPTGENAEGEGVTGAHVLGNNPGTVGVALLGTFTSAGPSQPALESLQRLLAWEADRHDIDPLGSASWQDGRRPTISGHRDVGATSCPGDALYAALPDVRQAVARLLGAPEAPPSSPAPPPRGYWLLDRNGEVQAFGQVARPFPPRGKRPRLPVVALGATPGRTGYWALSSSGQLTTFGDAADYSDAPQAAASGAPSVGLDVIPTGSGCWVLSADGSVAVVGDAADHGCLAGRALSAPVVGLASSPSGQGYWIVASDSGVFAFGDARFEGSAANRRLPAAVTAMAPHPSGAGYWLLCANGDVICFGAAESHGTLRSVGVKNAARSVQIRATASGNGYYILGADGGVFAFGDAPFHGASPGRAADRAAVDLVVVPGE